jgi:hypothetical protein
MFDPTTNRIIYGLLTKEEQEVLSNWENGLEVYDNGWHNKGDRYLNSGSVYRAKPLGAVTSIWHNVYSEGGLIQEFSRECSTRDLADENARNRPPRIAVLRVDTCNGVTTVHIDEPAPVSVGVSITVQGLGASGGSIKSDRRYLIGADRSLTGV